MIYIWILFISEAFISLILKSVLPEVEDIDAYSIIIVSTLFLAIVIRLIAFGKTNFERFFLFFALLFSTILIIRSSFIPLTEDAYRFHVVAILKSQGIRPKIYGGNYGGIYTDIQGLIYFFFGSRRMIMQYTGVLSMYTVFELVITILKRLDLDKNVYKQSIVFLTVSLNSIWIGTTVTREHYIRLMVALSIFMFFTWYINGKLKCLGLSVLFCLLGTALHSGIISIALGIAIFYILYDQKNKKFKLTKNNVLKVILVIVVFIIVWVCFKDELFRYFEKTESLEDLTSKSDRSGRGGSGYKAGFAISNPLLNFVINTPIRTFYFALVPFPWKWRGIFDIISFLFSSIYYFYGFYKVFKAVKNKIKNEYVPLMIGCFIMMLCGYIIYSWGVSNAGTALRHRDKFLPVYVIMLALGLQNKYEHNTQYITRKDDT